MYKTYMNISGYFHHISYDNHARYGPVVRIAPNLLSFSTPSAQKAIYGHPSPGSPNGPYPWYKGPAYAVDDDLNAGNNLAMVRDPVKHAEMVKMMNGAFSTQALRAQEDLVTIIMDRWIEQVGKYGAGRKQGADLRDGSVQNARGINMAKWYNWVTFDIIGDLAFGEAFGCVEMGKLEFLSAQPGC